MWVPDMVPEPSPEPSIKNHAYPDTPVILQEKGCNFKLSGNAVYSQRDLH